MSQNAAEPQTPPEEVAAEPVEASAAAAPDGSGAAATLDVSPPVPSSRRGQGWINFKNGVASLYHTLKWVVVVVAFFALLIWASSWNAQRTVQYSETELEKVRELVVYANRSATEAQRVSDPLQALLHIDYAVCYLNASKHLVPDPKTLEELTGTNLVDLEQSFARAQRRHLEVVERRMGAAAAAAPA